MSKNDDIKEEVNIKHVDYTKVQIDICDIGKEGQLPPTDPEYCPTCIIDENAPTKNWWNEQHPYLNGRTCEYYIPVTMNSEGRTYSTRELRDVRIPFNIFKYSYLRPGIRKALRFYNKVENDSIVCAKIPETEQPSAFKKFSKVKKHLYKDRDLWKHLGKFHIETPLTDKNGHEFRIQETNDALLSQFEDITNHDALELFASVKDYHLGNGFEPIKMLVVIPAYVFDQIPASIASVLGKKASDDEEEEEAKDEPYELKTEVELDAKEFKRNMRLMHRTFQAWQKYQAMFYSLQGGRIKQTSLDDDQKQVNFYIKRHTKQFEYFKEAMDDLLDVNGFELTKKKKRSAAEKIKITFALPTATKPYRIDKVEAKYPNCDYQPCSVNFQKFADLPATKNPTLLNFVAQLDESILFIRDLQETPWVDWLNTYTYPKVQVMYGDEEESAIPCVEVTKNPTEVDDAIFKLDFDLGELLQWFMAQFNCKTLADMADYDPMKDIGDLQNKFKKLLEGFTFTNNDAIKDLFGLPIDLKSMKGKKPLQMINDFFERITICNLASLLLEILKCLFNGFSLDELIAILIEKLLKSASVLLFEPIYMALEPVYQLDETVPQRASMRLGGFTTPPWDYYREIQKKSDTPGEYVAWYQGAANMGSGVTVATELSKQKDGSGVGALAGDIIDTFDGGLPGLTQSGWLYQNHSDLYQPESAGGGGPPAGPAPEFKPPFKKVFDVWVEEFMDELDNFEELLRMVENLPGGQLLKIALAMFGCPHQNFLKDLFKELKNMINLGSIIKGCSLGEPVFKLPKFRPFPTLIWKDILRILLNIIIKKLIDLIAMLLLAILLKLLLALSCAGLKALLDFLKNGFQLGNDSLEDAITETFCGEDNAEDGKQGDTPDLNSLLGAMDDQGVTGNPEDIMDLARDLSAGIPKNAFKDAFLQPPELQDPDLMAQIADIVTARHPQFASTLGDPNDVAMFFSGIGNLLNAEQRAVVSASIEEPEIDGPIDPSICLTNEQKAEWDAGRRSLINDLCGDLPLDGFRDGDGDGDDDLWPYPDDNKVSPTLGDDWVDKLNNRDTSQLDEFLDIFLNGPGAALGDMLEEALKQGVRNCAIDPETGEPIEMDDDDAAANMSIIPPMPVELSDIIDDAKKTMLFSVEQSFYNDLQGKYHSFFNHLLADSYNAPFYRGSRRRPSHDTLTKHPFIAPNAADTVEQWQGRWDTVKERRFSFPKLFMQLNAPRDDDFKPNTDAPFPTNVYPKTVGIWMREQLLSEAEEMEFKTDMGLRKNIDNDKVVREYTRRRWGMIDKPVSFFETDPAEPKAELVMSFRDNNNGKGGGWNYGFDLKLINYVTDREGTQLPIPGYRLVLDELESTNVPSSMTFTSRYGLPVAPPATIKVTRDTYLDVPVGVNPGNGSAVLDIYAAPVTQAELKKYSMAGAVFKNYVKNIYSALGVDTKHDENFLAKDLYDKLNNFIYSSVIKSVMDNPNGKNITLPGYTTEDADGEDVVVAAQSLEGVPEAFIFGYVNDNITRSDLTYVDPKQGGYSKSDPDTWEYDHKNKEKVLGHSATKNPRIEFLDPEIHDMGKYTKPKIYIKPPEYTGWLAINQLVVPEADNHEPKRKMFLFTDELIKKEKDLREEIPYDERLDDPHKCIQEGPYDVFSDPAGHAGTHVAVLGMCRLYAFEHLLKSMAMYQIVKCDYNNNYDESVLAAIVQDMEEDLKDLPRRRSKRGFFRGYSFWMLFLEQAVQTIERMLVVGDIESNYEIQEGLQKVKEVRESLPPLSRKWLKLLKHVRTIHWDGAGDIQKIDFAYSRKIKGKRKYYPMEYELAPEDEEVLRSYLEGVFFYSLGRNFKSILASESRNFAFRMRRRQRRLFKMSAKIYAVHKTKAVAKSLLKYIVGHQLTFYGDKLMEISNDEERAGPKPKPYIEDLKKYFFGSSDIMLTPFNGGTREEEEAFRQSQKDAADAGEPAPTYNYGANPLHVVHDPTLENPLDNLSSAQISKLADSPAGNFYLEKYLRIVDKPTGHDSETKWFLDNQKSTVSSRSNLLKGVVNIKEFQKYLKSNLTTLGAQSEGTKMGKEGELEEFFWHTKISNIFGNAVPVFEDKEEAEDPDNLKITGYDGSTGIRFGVRLCYVPPSDFNPSIQTSDSRREKSFKFKAASAELPDHNTRRIFPLVSYEKDLTDVRIVDLDLNDDNFGEDLNCYIHELLKTPEFDLMFDYCAPVRRAASMMAIYSNYAFLPSVGEHPQERDVDNGQRPTEYWKSVVLSQTKNSLRRLFIANYSSVLFYSEKVGSRKNGRNFNPFEMWKKLFQILINPFAFFASMAASWGGWRKARRIVDRPYDMYGEPEGADDGVE